MITLITDFGLESEYVGVMKGVILGHSPGSSIVDISHSVPPQDILRAAYMIRASFPYFPKRTVHVIVVDPGVGSKRDVVLLEVADHLFLFPDNGVATLLLDDLGPAARAYRISREDLFLEPVSATFHGRDIFAPMAANLDKGMRPSEVGPEIELGQLVRLEIPKPVVDIENGKILGEIVSIDNYGSLISNISRDNIFDWGYDRSASGFSVDVCEKTISSMSYTYSDVENGALLALIGSRGFLEIAVNGGNAARQLHASVGTEILLSVR